jgi:CO/xanthine dehydrogenase Mo-binding subunit
VRAAAAGCKRQLLDLAAQMLEVTDAGPDEFEVRDGDIVYRPDPAVRIPFKDATDRLGNHTLVGEGARGPNPEEAKTNTFGAQFAEVEVNVETGEVRVLRVVAVHDVGRVINPLTAASQVYGGIIQGASYATMEERILDGELGVTLNPDLEHYHLPTVMDVPEMKVSFVDLPDPELNNIGAKGLGEPPIIPTAPAIANAVHDATGLRLTDLPLTRRRVLEGLRARREEGER